MSLFQHLREDNGIWKVFIDGKEIYEAGLSQIAGGYRVSLVEQLPPEKVNKTLDFYNIFRKNEHEDYIYGQSRERKIGLFDFEPGVHTVSWSVSGPIPVFPSGNRQAGIQPLRRYPFCANSPSAIWMTGF